jgi:glycosyltransferase involved in cell wall biosynthesis
VRTADITGCATMPPVRDQRPLLQPPTPEGAPRPTSKGTPRPTPKGAPRPTRKGAPRLTPKGAPRPTPKGAPCPTPKGAPRLLVVSHPAVTSVNQEVYRELSQRGWEVTLVLPSSWRHDYSSAPVTPTALPGLEGALRPTPVAFAGRQQRHLYLTRCRSLAARARPDVAFVEAEPYALVATQWRRALAGLGVPFGVQCYENIDRPLPAPVRHLRTLVLRDAAFVAARSQSAARLAAAWGARGEIRLAPPAVPTWERASMTSADEGTPMTGGDRGTPVTRADGDTPVTGGEGDTPVTGGDRGTTVTGGDGGTPVMRGTGGVPFTIGYAGRLVESKGLLDLLAAVRRLAAPVELLLIGNGALRPQLEDQPIPGGRVRVLDHLTHARMAEGYAQLDVLVLPSRTTPTWKEQLGRAIVEALWCSVPVVGSDSGEIPWVIELTGGGLTFPEGDAAALAERLSKLRGDPALRLRLAQTGRAAVERTFSVEAATDALERLLVGAAPRCATPTKQNSAAPPGEGSHLPRPLTDGPTVAMAQASNPRLPPFISSWKLPR